LEQKKTIIIAGPNGAGKTTFAREFLPNEAGCPNFVNADLIAAGLSPFNPEVAAIKAARIMLGEIEAHAAHGDNFAFETTLSGRGYVRMIRSWRKEGYQVRLLNSQEAIARVAERVAQGGHNIPDDVVHRRFSSGIHNFQTIYRFEVDYWHLLDNSKNKTTLIDEGSNP
jgi:predicted ABC-type ATPase